MCGVLTVGVVHRPIYRPAFRLIWVSLLLIIAAILALGYVSMPRPGAPRSLPIRPPLD